MPYTRLYTAYILECDRTQDNHQQAAYQQTQRLLIKNTLHMAAEKREFKCRQYTHKPGIEIRHGDELVTISQVGRK